MFLVLFCQLFLTFLANVTSENKNTIQFLKNLHYLFISTFYFTQSYKIFPHHKMYHSTDNPHLAWIITALQAVQSFKYSSKDYWMSEVTAAESHKITQVWKESLMWSKLISQESSKLVLPDQNVQCVIQSNLGICEGKVHRPLGTLFQHLIALTVKDTDILETVHFTSAECRGRIIPDLLTSLLLRKLSIRWAFLPAMTSC